MQLRGFAEVAQCNHKCPHINHFLMAVIKYLTEATLGEVGGFILAHRGHSLPWWKAWRQGMK